VRIKLYAYSTEKNLKIYNPIQHWKTCFKVKADVFAENKNLSGTIATLSRLKVEENFDAVHQKERA
jgi:argininosuccinate synthase